MEEQAQTLQALLEPTMLRRVKEDWSETDMNP